jgi:hypothetical protein
MSDAGSTRRITQQLTYNGMLLWDHFAGAALQGLMANPNYNTWTTEQLAQRAYRQANKMLAIRAQMLETEAPPDNPA